MMRSKVFWLVGAAGLLAASGASAQMTKTARECRYVNGTQECTTTSDYGDKTSKMICSYPRGSIADSTCTFDDKPHALARERVGYSISDEERKAEIRKASGYRDPR